MLRLKLSPLNRRLLFTDSGGSAPLDSDYLAWKARVIQIGGSVQPDEELRINDAIVKQKADNNFDENDRQWIHCTSNINAAIVSLNNPLSNPLVLLNGIPFSPYEGFQGDGLTQYIDTQFNPFTDGVKYTLNSASFLSYFPNGINVAGYQGNFNGTTGFFWGLNAGTLNGGVNDSSEDISSINSSVGLCGFIRSSSTNKNSVLNGILSSNITRNSIGIPNLNIYLLCSNNNGAISFLVSTKLSFSSIGSGAIDQASFYDSIKPLVDGAASEI